MFSSNKDVLIRRVIHRATHSIKKKQKGSFAVRNWHQKTKYYKCVPLPFKFKTRHNTKKYCVPKSHPSWKSMWYMWYGSNTFHSEYQTHGWKICLLPRKGDWFSIISLYFQGSLQKGSISLQWLTFSFKYQKFPRQDPPSFLMFSTHDQTP